ncbi:MAG: DUF928 domain-containing protein [Cyanobacteria bacterium J06621_8]
MRSVLTLITVCSLLPLATAQSLAIPNQDGVLIDSEIILAHNKPSQKKQKSLDFSGTGRPGQQTAGESRGNCNSDSAFEALLPVSKSGKTVSGQPSFWVYFPKALPQQSQVEFVIQNKAREDIWRSRGQLDASAGYKKFAMPETAPPLEIDQWYRWYVKVYCDSQNASAQYVQGWVSRIPISSQLHVELLDYSRDSHLIYGNHSIWYDAINHLLSNYHNDVPNLNLEQDWQNLIGAKGVDLDQLPSIGGIYEAVKPMQPNSAY